MMGFAALYPSYARRSIRRPDAGVLAAQV